MGSVYITSRCKKILSRLLTEKDYISLQRIADSIAVSKRSIYYDLCKINEWLNFYGLPELEVHRRKGILIPPEEKNQIEDILNSENQGESYVFSPMERVKIIICYIIYYGDPLYIEQLAQCCQVSRNTIFNDLRVIVNQLQEYGLSLAYESKKGYRIEGDIIHSRAVFFSYFYELKPLFDNGILRFVENKELEVYLDKLHIIEKELNTEYVDGVLFSLASLLPLMYKSKEKPYFPNLKHDEIVKKQEFALILKYFPDLDDREQIYLCLHLLGSRVAVMGNEIFDSSTDQTVYVITKALVAEFEKVACIIFEDRESLERALFMHISTSLYRYQYGIQIGSPITTDVIREYPNLVDITKKVSQYLVRIIGSPIPDGEVAYLALHFGAHLKISNQTKEELRILIVCGNGVSTGNMLRREIQRLLPNAQIVDVVAAAVDVVNIRDMCDLVITTVKMKSELPVMVVHPILSDEDRKMILDYVKPDKMIALKESDHIFSMLQKYIKKEDYGKVKTELEDYFHDVPSEIKLGVKAKGLLTFLQQTEIHFTEEIYSWTDAIWLAGKDLIEKKCIKKKYLDMIVSQIQYYGPYMFITKRVVLAHAKPEDGVNRLGIKLVIFKKPVFFSETQQANIIIMLAPEDQESHLKILKDIMDVFSEESDERIDEIVKLDTHDEVIKYIQQYITD